MKPRSLEILFLLFLLNCHVQTWSQSDQRLDKAAASQALQDFKTALDNRWSYRQANSADFDSPFNTLRAKAAGGISLNELGLELHKIIALGIDGHSGVVGYQLPGSRFLPFLVEPAGEHFVAFHTNRASFLAKDFPYLIAIDGKPIRDWLNALSIIVPKGTPQYVRQRSLGRLRNIDFARSLLKLPQRDAIEVEVETRDGRRRQTLTIPAATALPTYGVWPRAGTNILPGNMAYLRISYMTDEGAVQPIKEWMPKFRNTTGLIIDVRDNDGGGREALPIIYSFLTTPSDPPRVFTAAAYRLHPAHQSNHLGGGYFLYRAQAPEWSTAQRRAVAEFASNFKPQWDLPKGQFSDWHYMAIPTQYDSPVYHYDKPVIILMNAKCFSATDIFLAGLKGVKNVTLMGTPSSGGSANTQEISLGSTPLRLRIGSMASFKSDGRLFDGHGSIPDVIMDPDPEYFIGGRDNLLEAAKERLQRRSP